MKNKQGGYVMLNLATNKEITSTRITQVPITDLVIRTVEELAAQDGMTPLKIENRTQTMIYNNDMLPRLDYEADNEPVAAGHDPTYVPRPQHSYDNELGNERNYAPITYLNLTTSGPMQMISFWLASPATEPRLMLVMLLSQLPLDAPRCLLLLQPVWAGVPVPSLDSHLHTARC